MRERERERERYDLPFKSVVISYIINASCKGSCPTTELRFKNMKFPSLTAIYITPKQRAKISVPSISVNGEIVKILNIPIGNLGCVFDPSMNMAAHVSKAVKSAKLSPSKHWKDQKILDCRIN